MKCTNLLLEQVNMAYLKDENNPAIKPILWICTTDKSATWKVLQRGGACKNKSLFCESCECTSLEIISYKVEKYRCEWCKTKKRKMLP